MDSDSLCKLKQRYFVYNKRYELINGKVKITYSIVV